MLGLVDLRKYIRSLYGDDFCEIIREKARSSNYEVSFAKVISVKVFYFILTVCELRAL